MNKFEWALAAFWALYLSAVGFAFFGLAELIVRMFM